MTRLSAREMLDVLIDQGSWTSWDITLPDVGGSAEYADELECARAKTGIDESILTGVASIRGHQIAIAVCEFGFLGGSIGVGAGDRLTAAIRRATTQRLPLLVLPTSGGTRMQEGTTAFLQMVRITAAIADLKAAGLPYLVYLRHPTTGGVFASWGSLGHLTFAEPQALIGFLGPRVYEALHGSPFPPNVQTAENLHQHGLLDAVCRPEDLAGLVAATLDIVATPSRASAVTPASERVVDTVPAWLSVQATRHVTRPGVQDLLATAATDVVALNGTAQGEVDTGLIVALVRFDDVSCVLVGQDRLAQADSAIGPAALRQARRGMRLAAELGLPLVSVIDTPGAALSPEAEEGGVAGEIARCIADMIALDVPTVSILLGQGTGGAALALFPADRTLGTAHGWLSPLPPEGASAILYQNTRRAPEIAQRQGVRAADLLASGALDRVIPECPDARSEPKQFCNRVAAAIRQELASLAMHDPATRLRSRIGRFDRLVASAPSVAAESA
ncbi:carboxyl transferase domain-containing protein [Mycolicibacterium stellerae]|uniref:carboxyl transferase domain-containing protein n=1 Tax=Mycolicibacterium stellerae TaxID=2358193 RepID=UPI000F0B9076|nr:carboxyl transferase domain-containing protein [Mycolicibacterium stellerae]